MTETFLRNLREKDDFFKKDKSDNKTKIQITYKDNWMKYSKFWKKHRCHPKRLYSINMCFKIEDNFRQQKIERTSQQQNDTKICT